MSNFRSSKVNSGTALEALGWRLFFFPPGGPGPDDLSLQTAVKTTCFKAPGVSLGGSGSGVSIVSGSGFSGYLAKTHS